MWKKKYCWYFSPHDLNLIQFSIQANFFLILNQYVIYISHLATCSLIDGYVALRFHTTLFQFALLFLEVFPPHISLLFFYQRHMLAITSKIRFYLPVAPHGVLLMRLISRTLHFCGLPLLVWLVSSTNNQQQPISQDSGGKCLLKLRNTTISYNLQQQLPLCAC